MKLKPISRLRRLEATAEKSAATGDRPALLASVIEKLDRVCLGEELPPADWTNAPPEVKAHRDRLLSRLESKKL